MSPPSVWRVEQHGTLSISSSLRKPEYEIQVFDNRIHFFINRGSETNIAKMLKSDCERIESINLQFKVL